MRKLLAITSILALGAVLAVQAQTASKKPTAAPLTPRRAGEFAIHMLNGSETLLSSYHGKVVVMAFMFTTCSHCQHTAGVLAKIQNEYAKKGVQVLGDTIDNNAKQGLPMFLKITGANNFPVGYSDPAQALKFLHVPADGWYVPMLAFIDRNGIVRSQYVITETDSSAGPFLEDQDGDPKTGNPGSFRREIDRLLKIPLTASTTGRRTPKS